MSQPPKKRKKGYVKGGGDSASSLDSLFSGSVSDGRRQHIARPLQYGTKRGPSLAKFVASGEGGSSDEEEAASDNDAEDDEEGGKNTGQAQVAQSSGQREMAHLKRLRERGITLRLRERGITLDDGDGEDGEVGVDEDEEKQQAGAEEMEDADEQETASGPVEGETKKQARLREREERRRKMAKIFNDTKGETFEKFTTKGVVHPLSGEVLPEKGPEPEIKDAWMDSLEDQGDKEGGDSALFSSSSSSLASSSSSFDSSSSSADSADEAKRDEFELKKILLQHMHPGESVLKALKRLGGGPSKTQLKKKNVRTKTKPSDDATATKEAGAASDDKPAADAAEQKRQFEELTGAANELLAQGVFSIYQDVYGKIKWQLECHERKLQAEAKAREEVLKSTGPKWEFRWNTKDQLRGPHTAKEMQAWQDAGYFKHPDMRVRLHQDGQADAGWQEVGAVKSWEEGFKSPDAAGAKWGTEDTPTTRSKNHAHSASGTL
eukprot:g22807.t1